MSKPAGILASPKRDTLFRDASAVERLGMLGVLIFAFFTWAGVAGVYIGLGMVTIATLMLWRQVQPLLWRMTVTKALVFMALYVLVWGCVLLITAPAAASLTTEKWLLLLLPWLPFWFCRFPRLIPWALCLAAVGLFFKTIKHVLEHGGQFLNVWRGEHIFVARGWGFYLSIVVLGLIVFIPRVFSLVWNRKWGWLVLVAYVSCTVWMLQCIVASQERTAWATFSIAVFLVLCVAVLHAVRNRRTDKVAFAAYMLAAAAISGIAVMNMGVISQRLAQDGQDIRKIFAGDQALSNGSAAQRYEIYKYGLEHWRRSPVFGLGPRSSKEIFRDSPAPTLRAQPHFHNLYLETLVQLGMVGLVIFMTVVACLLYDLLRSYLAGMVAEDYALFIGCVFVMISLWGLLSSRLLHTDWLAFWVLLAGVTQSLGMRYRVGN